MKNGTGQAEDRAGKNGTSQAEDRAGKGSASWLVRGHFPRETPEYPRTSLNSDLTLQPEPSQCDCNSGTEAPGCSLLGLLPAPLPWLSTQTSAP